MLAGFLMRVAECPSNPASTQSRRRTGIEHFGTATLSSFRRSRCYMLGWSPRKFGLAGRGTVQYGESLARAPASAQSPS
jgi:hypothetical protein